MTIRSTLKLCTLAAATTLAATSALAAPATYAIEPSHTFVTWEAKHFGTSTNRGRFDKKSGSVTIDTAAKTGKVEVTIEMGSISTGTGPFDAHLKGKDFFSAEVFPTAKFVGDKFTFDGDKVTEVAGTLTMLGKTAPITLKATGFGCYDNPFFKRQVCGGDFEATLTRSAFGMTYGLPGIPDQIKLVIQVEAVKQ
jgi:polyisoprenoid-binding protein YceI